MKGTAARPRVTALGKPCLLLFPLLLLLQLSLSPLSSPLLYSRLQIDSLPVAPSTAAVTPLITPNTVTSVAHPRASTR
jgi:hypothetical protein